MSRLALAIVVVWLASFVVSEAEPQKEISREIDPDAHVLGIPFGTPQDELVARLGEPNGTLTFSDGRTGLIYGRRTAFFLTAGELTGIWLGPRVVDALLALQIPEHPILDDVDWRLTNGIAPGTNRQEVKEIVDLHRVHREGYSPGEDAYTTRTATVELMFGRRAGEKGDTAYRVYGVLVTKRNQKQNQ